MGYSNYAIFHSGTMHNTFDNYWGMRSIETYVTDIDQHKSCPPLSANMRFIPSSMIIRN